MFTGIIKEIGIVEDIRPKGPVRRISIKTDTLAEKTGIGDSISVDGVCLTVVSRSRNLLYFDLAGETLGKTTLGYIKRKERVNLVTLEGHRLSPSCFPGAATRTEVLKMPL